MCFFGEFGELLDGALLAQDSGNFIVKPLDKTQDRWVDIMIYKKGHGTISRFPGNIRSISGGRACFLRAA